MGLKDYWDNLDLKIVELPKENIRHQNVLDRNSEYLWECMEDLWVCKEYSWEWNEYLWECEKDLMSTGTSSTFAKVDLILSLTTPYFANNLDLKLGHRWHTCIFVGTLSKSAHRTIDIEWKVKCDDGSHYFSTASLSPECCIVTYSLTRSFTEFSSFLKFT